MLSVKKKSNKLFIVWTIFLIVWIMTLAIYGYCSKREQQEENIFVTVKKHFELSVKYQYNDRDVYIILPEFYSGEEIEKYLYMLGISENMSLTTVEFDKHHVIYHYKR